MTPIERELKTMLEERATSYDARAALPRRVARRARTYRAATGAAAGGLVAAVVLAGMLGPRALTTAEPVRPAAPTPRDDGMVVEGFSGSESSGPGFDARPADIVATGRVAGGRWALSLDRQRDGECLTLEVPRFSMSSCGDWAGTDAVVEIGGRARVRGAGVVGVFGYASANVARITVTTESGTTVRARLVPAGSRLPQPATLWAAFVPRGERVTVVAHDVQGTTLARERLGAYGDVGR